MKTRYVLLLLIVLTVLLCGCTKESVLTEHFGQLEGEVYNAETYEPLPWVSVTTTPASSAIFTQLDGRFELYDLITGNYSVQVRKMGFENASVSVAVRENQTARAVIVMKPITDNKKTTVEDLKADVSSWFNVSRNDSNFVRVEYAFTNTGDSTEIKEYEVYFQIKTNATTFFTDVRGTNLKPGQFRYGSFSKYILGYTASEVKIIEKWVAEE